MKNHREFTGWKTQRNASGLRPHTTRNVEKIHEFSLRYENASETHCATDDLQNRFTFWQIKRAAKCSP